MFGGLKSSYFKFSSFYDNHNELSQKNGIPEYYRSFGNHRIATHLRKQGWDVECLDYIWTFSYDELTEYVDKRITKDTVFIGISVIFFVEKTHTEIINKLMKYVKTKYPWVTTISGGVKGLSITCIDADYYIAGNGEYAIDSLLKYLRGSGEKPKQTKLNKTGIMVIDAVKDYPCYPKRDANISYEDRDFIKPYETLNIELGRGCRFKCNYCNFPLIGLKGNMMRDEDSVYDEFRENYERWGVSSYYITDDTVNDTKEKMRMVGNAVRRLSFQPQLNGYARADLMISHGKETWNDMIDAGFTSHSYGIESFNHQSAKSMGKGMHPDKMKDGLLEIQDYFWEKSEYFYEGSMTMIAGLPHETFETLDDTKSWLNTYWKDNFIAYLPLYLIPSQDEGLDEIDGNINEDFINMGYEFMNIETLMSSVTNLELKKAFISIGESKEVNKNIDKKSSAWIHPSGDYDWIDAIEWIREFHDERKELGINSTYCFDGGAAWMSEYVNGTLQNIKEYYESPCKIVDISVRDDFLNEYKTNKLSYK